MVDNTQTSKSISLEKYGIKNAKVNYQLTPKQLQAITVEKGMGKETANGTLAINTGKYTGRSPQDRFLVKDDYTADKVWWGKVNKPVSSENFNRLQTEIEKYLSGKELFVRDGYVCADPKYRLNVRTVTELPWSNMFIYNMFLRPEASELDNFKEDWLILCAPGYECPDPQGFGIRQGNFSILDFTKKVALVGGSAYTGEMKKGIFSALNMILPVDKNVLPMHCSANVGEDGDTAIFFGLSGTGKTTLSTDPKRKLIGDDEHGWDDDGIFNFEGGCYAKTIRLSQEAEPEIYGTTTRFGTVLENVVLNDNREPDFDDGSLTENTRCAYPLHFIPNASETGKSGHPLNIIMLTADAFGILPPIAKLTPDQAMYHFLSGYTAKVAGTEKGVTEPEATFSTCFGAPSMPRPPAAYGNLLRKLLAEHGVNCWLVNTGWTGGAYGVGNRMPIKATRALLTAALDGTLNDADYRQDTNFGFQVPVTVEGVETSILDPRSTWDDKDAYDQMATRLVDMFVTNFEKFENHVDGTVRDAAPGVRLAAE